jgi:hypothetical protein
VKRESFGIWRLLSSLGIVASAAMHLGTFFGIGQLGRWGIPVLHVFIVVPFMAGVSYADRLMPGAKGWFNVAAFSPRWLKLLSGILLVYALTYGAMTLGRAGTTQKRGQKYVLVSKNGQVLRELTRQEFDQRRLQTWRAAMVMCMTVASAGLMFLVGARNLARERGQLVGASKES